MALIPTVKILEQCGVSPPPGSVEEASLPLTHFDVIWIQLPPVQRIFFYDFSHPENNTTHFLTSLLPNLKHCLSLSLQLFFPLAAKLVLSTTSFEHELFYTDGNSVSFTVVESSADFRRLISEGRKQASEFHHLASQLPTSALLAVQVTVFPNAGICIGITMHHVVADGRSLTHFMKSWAAVCRTGDQSSVTSLPFFDRSVIKDRVGLKRILLEQMEKFKLGQKLKALDVEARVDPVRATFLLSRLNTERLKQRVKFLQSRRTVANAKPLHCSSFVVTCAFVWVCLIRARGESGYKMAHFSFAVDARARLDPPIPDSYFGNCISRTMAEAAPSELAKEDGLATASEAIGRAVERMADGVLKGAEGWIPKYTSLASQRYISVAGSPTFRVYDMNFGWGRPVKTEVISIDRTGAMYIGDSREGGIEIGLALPKCEMDSFASLFEEGLKHSSVTQ